MEGARPCAPRLCQPAFGGASHSVLSTTPISRTAWESFAAARSISRDALGCFFQRTPKNQLTCIYPIDAFVATVSASHFKTPFLHHSILHPFTPYGKH